MTRPFKTWTDLLLAGAEHRPDVVGFGVVGQDGQSEEITRAALVDRALRVLNGLQGAGLRKGSVVVLLGEPSVSWIVTFSAILLGGGVPAPMHPRTAKAEFERVMAKSGARLAVVSTTSAALALDGAVEGAADGATFVTLEHSGAGVPSIADMGDLDQASAVPCVESDHAIILQTSGTTGPPKLVVHTHASHLEFVDKWIELTMTPDDRILSFLPMNHQAGLLMGWASAFALGNPFYRLNRFSVSEFWGAVHEHGITWTSLMDPVPSYLLAEPPHDDDRSHTLRFVASSRRPEQVAEMDRRFGIRMMRPYGSTETTFIAMTVDLDRPAAGGLTPEQAAVCSGPPVRACGFRIIRPDGSQATAGEVGALEVYSPSLFACYLNDPEATAAALTADGWFKTGDRAYVNKHDELFFVEREGSSIRRSGENISAVEVEEVLLAHPGVKEVCVVAVPDQFRGQEVRACVVRTPGATVTAEELFDHCLATLTKFKVPRYLDFWDVFPRTATFKIARTELDSDAATWTDRYRAKP